MQFIFQAIYSFGLFIQLLTVSQMMLIKVSTETMESHVAFCETICVENTVVCSFYGFER